MPKSKMSLAKSVKTIKKSIKKMMPKSKVAKLESLKVKKSVPKAEKASKIKAPSKGLSLGSLKNKKVESFKNVKSAWFLVLAFFCIKPMIKYFRHHFLCVTGPVA